MFSNELSPAEAERLAMLAEEAGEIVQAVAKILRHGYRSHHPDEPGVSNRHRLSHEVADLHAVLRLMDRAGDAVSPTAARIESAMHRKLRYAHHQQPLMPPAPTRGTNEGARDDR